MPNRGGKKNLFTSTMNERNRYFSEVQRYKLH
jgi:hypothetical protein